MINKLYNSYQKNGFVVSRKVFDLNEISFLEKEINNFILKKRKNYKNIHHLKKNIVSSIHNINDFKLVKILQKNKKIKKIVQNIVGRDAKKFGAEIFSKPPKIGRFIPPHQDNFFWCTKKNSGITIWIAINDSNKKNGGIYYYNGSHKFGLLEHEISYMPGTSQKIKNFNSLKIFKKNYPLLKAGDCLIHSSVVVHGSDENKSNKSRKGLTLRYISKNDDFDNLRKKYYERALKQSIKGK